MPATTVTGLRAYHDPRSCRRIHTVHIVGDLIVLLDRDDDVNTEQLLELLDVYMFTVPVRDPTHARDVVTTPAKTFITCRRPSWFLWTVDRHSAKSDCWKGHPAA